MATLNNQWQELKLSLAAVVKANPELQLRAADLLQLVEADDPDVRGLTDKCRALRASSAPLSADGKAPSPRCSGLPCTGEHGEVKTESKTAPVSRPPSPSPRPVPTGPFACPRYADTGFCYLPGCRDVHPPEWSRQNAIQAYVNEAIAAQLRQKQHDIERLATEQAARYALAAQATAPQAAPRTQRPAKRGRPASNTSTPRSWKRNRFAERRDSFDLEDLDQALEDVPRSRPKRPDPRRRLVGIEPNPGPGWRDQLRDLTFAIHGDYCGPGWTGRSFAEPNFAQPPKDALDAVCRRHDYNYTRMPKQRADAIMARELESHTFNPLRPRRSLIALAAKHAFRYMAGGVEPGPDPEYPWDTEPSGREFRAPPRVLTPRHGASPLPPLASTATTQAVELNPGPGGRAGPRSASSRTRGSAGGAVYRARDLLFSGTISTNLPAGTVIFSCPINPSGKAVAGSPSITAAYLNYRALEYEMFDIQARFIVKRTGAMTLGGTFTHGIDSDVSDVLPTGLEAVQRLEGQGGSTHTYAEGGTAGYNRVNAARFVSKYWLNPLATSDPRTCAKGKYWLVTNEPPQSWFAGGASTAVSQFIQVFIEYRVTFYNPTLEVSTSSIGLGNLTLVDSALTTLATTNPLSIGATMTTKTTDGESVGLVVTTDGTGSVLAFPAANFEDVSTIILFFATVGNSVSYTCTEVSGATGAAVTTLNSSGYGTVVRVTLANATANYTVGSTCYRRVRGGWTTLIGSPSMPVYATVRIVSNTTASVTQVCFGVSSLAANMGFAAKMARCAGPACAEYYAYRTWDRVRPFEDHLALHLARERAAQRDLTLATTAQATRVAQQRVSHGPPPPDPGDYKTQEDFQAACDRWYATITEWPGDSPGPQAAAPTQRFADTRPTPAKPRPPPLDLRLAG